jgi:hypothetical protein
VLWKAWKAAAGERRKVGGEDRIQRRKVSGGGPTENNRHAGCSHRFSVKEMKNLLASIQSLKWSSRTIKPIQLFLFSLY